MFDFIKKIFRSEEVLVQEEVKATELSQWVEQKLSEISFQSEIGLFLKGIENNKEILSKKTEILESTNQIKDEDKIEVRVKNIVRGHKNKYCKEMKHFLEQLNIPQKFSLDQAIAFNNNLSSSLDELAKRTAKSYQAAQHLFFDQVEDVFKTVGELNLLTKNFEKKLKQNKLEQINQVREKINFVLEEIQKKKSLEEEIRAKNEQLNLFLREEQKLQQELKSLTESEEYGLFRELKNKKTVLSNSIHDAEDKINLFFSKLNRALRKYERVTLETKLVSEYLNDPLIAIDRDNELKIIEVLKKLRSSIDENKVDLAPKQKEKVLKVIKEAEGGYLNVLINEREKLKSKKVEIIQKFGSLNINKQVEMNKNQAEGLREQIKKMLDETEKIKIIIDNPKDKLIKDELQELIKDILKIELKIVP